MGMANSKDKATVVQLVQMLIQRAWRISADCTTVRTASASMYSASATISSAAPETKIARNDRVLRAKSRLDQERMGVLGLFFNFLYFTQIQEKRQLIKI